MSSRDVLQPSQWPQPPPPPLSVILFLILLTSPSPPQTTHHPLPPNPPPTHPSIAVPGQLGRVTGASWSPKLCAVCRRRQDSQLSHFGNKKWENGGGVSVVVLHELQTTSRKTISIRHPEITVCQSSQSSLDRSHIDAHNMMPRNFPSADHLNIQVHSKHTHSFLKQHFFK
jgi:hypothetical protein